MSRLVWIVAAIGLPGCAALRPKAPEPIVRTDTVTVTKEVAAPLPEGDTTTICLGNGMPVQVRVAAHADTLIGEARVHLRDVRPLLDFVGVYAQDQDWFARSDTLRFERRLYRRSGVPVQRACDELKQVGTYQGVYVYADVTAPATLPVITLPVRPGMFQAYFLTTSSKSKSGARR